MTDHETSFASFDSARPWGSVRRKNVISRLTHAVFMTLLGLVVLGAFALAVVFAASVAVVGMVVLALVAVMAVLRRTPAKVFVNVKADGVMEARKKGSTWSVY